MRGVARWRTRTLPNVRLVFNWGNQIDTILTDSLGQYSLPRPLGATAVGVAVSFNGNGTEFQGINVVDVVSLRRHILALDTLSPLALLAADVNNSGMETVSDIVRITQVILGINPWIERPNWLVFPTLLPLTPLPRDAFGPFNITLNNPNAGVITLDFTVLKNGDVNFTAY
ncbi:MAG: hypothetical protein HC821_01840 [Lewinella sp.]|nr:hypothetical protein [Lewinella sp.]